MAEIAKVCYVDSGGALLRRQRARGGLLPLIGKFLPFMGKKLPLIK
jgi:hypothetical protein